MKDWAGHCLSPIAIIYIYGFLSSIINLMHGCVSVRWPRRTLPPRPSVASGRRGLEWAALRPPRLRMGRASGRRA